MGVTGSDIGGVEDDGTTSFIPLLDLRPTLQRSHRNEPGTSKGALNASGTAKATQAPTTSSTGLSSSKSAVTPDRDGNRNSDDNAARSAVNDDNEDRGIGRESQREEESPEIDELQRSDDFSEFKLLQVFV